MPVSRRIGFYRQNSQMLIQGKVRREGRTLARQVAPDSDQGEIFSNQRWGQRWEAPGPPTAANPPGTAQPGPETAITLPRAHPFPDNHRSDRRPSSACAAVSLPASSSWPDPAAASRKNNLVSPTPHLLKYGFNSRPRRHRRPPQGIEPAPDRHHHAAVSSHECRHLKRIKDAYFPGF